MLEDFPIASYLVESSNSLAALYGKYAKYTRARILGNNIVVIAAWSMSMDARWFCGRGRSGREMEMMWVYIESGR